jgi:hypothetical protein
MCATIEFKGKKKKRAREENGRVKENTRCQYRKTRERERARRD